MCSFITLVVQGETANVPAILHRHGRKAAPTSNASIQRVLRESEAQLLTTSGHCDCGTVLAARPEPPPDWEREADRLPKKGLSKTKIARAMRDRETANDCPGSAAIDSFAFWTGILRDVLAAKGVTGAGVLVHSYSGDVATEQFAISRREVLAGSAMEAELAQLRQDELLMVCRS